MGRVDEEQFQGMNVRAVANNMEAMLALVLTGNYIGLLPDHLAEKWVQEERLWPLNAPAMEASVASFAGWCLRSLNLSTAVATLVPLILAEIKHPRT